MKKQYFWPFFAFLALFKISDLLIYFWKNFSAGPISGMTSIRARKYKKFWVFGQKIFFKSKIAKKYFHKSKITKIATNHLYSTIKLFLWHLNFFLASIIMFSNGHTPKNGQKRHFWPIIFFFQKIISRKRCILRKK